MIYTGWVRSSQIKRLKARALAVSASSDGLEQACNGKIIRLSLQSCLATACPIVPVREINARSGVLYATILHVVSWKSFAAGAFIPASMCPKDGSAFCWDKKGVPVPLYMDSSRDCSSGQGSRCTKDEPCTPCDLDAVEAFLAVGASGVSRCRQCGVGNSGACHFVLDEGPYCWKEPGSSEIEPCSICCTSAQVGTRGPYTEID
ncbi:unnamed protein product [Ascophyllum nodosum]